MALWLEFVRCLYCLRGACRRRRTFMWLAVVLVAWAVRFDLLGVTSLVRSSFLQPASYHLLLHFFHSNALVLDLLLAAWVRLAMSLFRPLTEGGYLILAADGLKVAKEGRKMPAVKCLHQESSNNSKSEFIMGHSFQVISLLVTAVTGQAFAVPLVSRICEGVIWKRSARRKTLLDKLAMMFLEVVGIMGRPALLVADAYYASRKVIEPLLQLGHQLISRVRSNAVAYHPPLEPRKRQRGRPKKYGGKVQLRNLFKAWQTFAETPSPVYDEQGITIRYRSVDLLWRPVGRLIRFVLVKHPQRGNIILLCTDLKMDPLVAIKIYGLRFKIEVSFKQALHTLGAYAYHFWMRNMIRIRWGAGDQNVAERSPKYVKAVERKIAAYHRYVQVACILQGLLQHLAINFSSTVWARFRSWLRTMNKDLVPSEMVTAQALRAGLPEYLLDSSTDPELKQFLLERVDYDRLPMFTMAA